MYGNELEGKHRNRANKLVLFSGVFFCSFRVVAEIAMGDFRAAAICGVIATIVIMLFVFFSKKNIKRFPLIFALCLYVSYIVASFFIGSFKYFYVYYVLTLLVCAVYFNAKNFLILFITTQIANIFLTIFKLSSISNSIDGINGNIWVHFSLIFCSGLILFLMVEFAIRKSSEASNATASFGALMRSTPNVLVLLDGDNKIRYISQSVSKIFGIKEPEELAGTNFLDLFNEKSVRDLFEDIAKKRSFYEDYQKINVNGQIRTFNVFANKMTDDGMFFMLNDVSEITKLKELAEQDSLIDGLIQIPNRRSFDKQIVYEWNRALREKVNLSFLMIDIDFFKNYNDTYGHLQGDELLKVAGAIFKKNLKRSADFVARFGGEEFGVLLYGTNSYQASVIAERIRKSVEEEIILTTTGAQTKFTISIGVCSMIPGNNFGHDHIIEAADKALYKAKQNGRNRIWISD
jgi:diguanylate cyclase (GGDEF)-like protein/PAS domain S-box-containing protein